MIYAQKNPERELVKSFFRLHCFSSSLRLIERKFFLLDQFSSSSKDKLIHPKMAKFPYPNDISLDMCLFLRRVDLDVLQLVSRKNDFFIRCKRFSKKPKPRHDLFHVILDQKTEIYIQSFSLFRLPSLQKGRNPRCQEFR